MNISDLHSIQTRFLRSANLERDFADPSALVGYIVTNHINSSLKRLAAGLDPKSGQRAWRITGDYGSGKSSFALLLAHLLSGREKELPTKIRTNIDFTELRKVERRFVPVLINGSREPLAVAVLRTVERAVRESYDKRNSSEVLGRIGKTLSKDVAAIDDREAVSIILDANRELIAKKRGRGLFIIIDELGKFLEFAALHPERQDIFFLQQLAEASSRSGKEPIFVVGLLHQGFNAYADRLSQASQKEWEKVAGRFEEILFDQPLDQVVHLIAAALNAKRDLLPGGINKCAKTVMRQVVEWGWLGNSVSATVLTQSAADIYPLHPTVIPVLVRLFSRFGQNERSLFSFLSSSEPHGLQSFCSQKPATNTFFRLSDLYDYAASSFGHRLSVQSYRNHWNHIDSLIRSFPARDEVERSVLKAAGILNLVNSPELTPTEEALVLAVSGDADAAVVRAAINRLHKQSHILYQRGRSGGYCLWSHASVDLEGAYEEAGKAVAHNMRVSMRIKDYLDSRPIVARRHYIQTGNLRHFDISYCGADDLKDEIGRPLEKADGRIIVTLCENAEECIAGEAAAKGHRGNPELLVGMTEPLSNLEKLLHEVERWEWVQKNTPELQEDRYANEEVLRQLEASRQTLEKQIQYYTGLRQSSQTAASSLRWFNDGKRVKIGTNKEITTYLSSLCDDLYGSAPKIQNELVNRRSISTAAASARMRLIERMFAAADKPYLGMDSTKKPPEMSIYLSILRQAKLHIEKKSCWALNEPKTGHDTDPLNIAPGIRCVLEMLESSPDVRVNVSRFFAALRTRPYGIRDGVIPILLALVIVNHQHEIALYENGTFLSRVGSDELQRLIKNPGAFDLQYCRVQGIRLTLFEQLLNALNVRKNGSAEVLDIVRPLCTYVSELPPYSLQTKRLAKGTLAVREHILSAREPVKLLFTDLPSVLGYGPFVSDGTKEKRSDAQQFSLALKTCIDELRMAHSELNERIRQKLLDAFDLCNAHCSFQEFRSLVSERAEKLIVCVKEPDLKAFCFRLKDDQLSEPDWIESVAAGVANTPPTRWRDEDEQTFEEGLTRLARRFAKLESLNYQGGGKHVEDSLRVAVTRNDGTEQDEVICLSKSEDAKVGVLENTIRHMLPDDKKISAAAMSRIIWDLLKKVDK